MKLKVLFPIGFTLLLSSFTAYSVLDTLVLESNDYVEVDDEDEDESFAEKVKNNETSQESSTNNKTENKDDNKTEDKNKTEPTPVVKDKSGTDNLGEYLRKYETDDLKIRIHKETIKTKHMQEDRMMDTIVYCADVKISDYSHFRTRFAKARNATKPTYGMNITNTTSEIAKDGGAIFAINGDYYGAREKGYVVRNGKTYRDYGYKTDRDDLVVYGDGSFGIFNEKNTSLKTITDSELGAWQVFSFGPALVVNSEVNVAVDAEVTSFSQLGNQRCAIGIYEPLHYFIAVCDGRLADSYGMSLYEAASFMKEKGVKTAYNLDGGGSATIWFDGEVLNRPNGHGEIDLGERKISDIIFFK